MLRMTLAEMQFWAEVLHQLDVIDRGLNGPSWDSMHDVVVR